jgi:epoxyqueuosine reductase
MHPMHSVATALKQQALALGFDRVGIAPAVTPPGHARLLAWIEAGYAGTMSYLTDRVDALADPRRVLDGARSVVMLLDGYHNRTPADAVPEGWGRIARYAWGDDYHDVIRRRLHRLADWLRDALPGAAARGVVDTAPLAEREFAQLAGLGWLGKNTLLLNPELGSWFFLAALLTDAELEYDQPFAADHCGTCRACIDACPTAALVDEYVLDARRCISYLTIELRDSVPPPLRQPLGDWVFGCDVCQDVCPWNRKPPEKPDSAYVPRAGHDPLELTELFELDDAAFRRRFRHSPLWRPRRRGLLRNAALVLGNQRAAGAVPALIRGLADDEPLVRGACAWALGRIRTPAALAALASRHPLETDPAVRADLAAALAPDSAAPPE